MKIVIDIGCARYGGDYSIERLIEEFHPDVLYGFDPNPATTDKPAGQCEGYDLDGTAVFVERLAAWTHKGEIGYLEDGLNSCISHSGEPVECFDLADYIRRRPDGAEVILKIDAEGSEYDLLEHLIETGADERLSLAWVEWHDLPDGTHVSRRVDIERNIRCQVDEWRW